MQTQVKLERETYYASALAEALRLYKIRYAYELEAAEAVSESEVAKTSVPHADGTPPPHLQAIIKPTHATEALVLKLILGLCPESE